MSQSRPEWFDWAIAQTPGHHDLEVAGTRVHYRSWGRSGEPLIVLVHGGAAHSGWWDHVGPHLAEHHRVVAVDLAGHGDSAHQDEYSLENWAEQVMAVADAESDAKPVIFGHSMGGFVALTAAREHGESLHGVAAIDSPVREVPAEAREWFLKRMQENPVRIEPVRDELVARFRTIPEDPHQLPWVLAHIADGSVKEVEGGWSWKFDRRIFFRSQMGPDQIAEANCDVALIRGEHGMATVDITADVRERLGGRAPVTMIPEAAHHVMIDQPVALIAVLQTLAGQWRNR